MGATALVIDALANRLFVLRAAGISLVALLMVLALLLKLPIAYQQLLITSIAWLVLHGFILFSQRRWAVTPSSITLQLATDIFMVSSLLAFSGGVHNPFFSLLLLPILLTAGILPNRAHYALLALVSLSAILLIIVPAPIHTSVPNLPNALYQFLFFLDGSLVRLAPFNPIDVIAKIGLGLNLALIALLVTLFVNKLHQQLRQQQQALQQAQLASQSQQHLLSMSLSAASTAHELSTPLASISLLAEEVKDAYAHQETDVAEQALTDIQRLVQTCKQQISSSLTQHQLNPSDQLSQQPWSYYMQQLLVQWKTLYPQTRIHFHSQQQQEMHVLAEPNAITLSSLTQSIHSLLNNAREASQDDIQLKLSWDETQVQLCVHNQGTGFPNELLANFPQPQHSHKLSGHGVGLTLAEANIRQLGGQLSLSNPIHGGALACIRLPYRLSEWQVPSSNAALNLTERDA